MEPGNRRRWALVTTAVVILLIVLLLVLVDVDAVVRILRKADWGLMLLGVPFLLASYLLLPVRWRYLLGNAPSLKATQHVEFSGMMLSIIAPMPTAPYRIVAMSRTTDVKATTAASSIAVEYIDGLILRLIGLALGTVLYLGSLKRSDTSILVGAGMIILMIAGLFLLVRHRERFASKLARALARVPRVRADQAARASSAVADLLEGTGTPRQFAVALLISLAYWASALAFYWLVLQGLGTHIQVPPLVVALGALFLAPPASPMMFGLFHSVLIAPLVALDWMSIEAATAYAVVLHASMMAILVALGSWGLSRLDLQLGELLAGIRHYVRRSAHKGEPRTGPGERDGEPDRVEPKGK